jgi:hypothetical protein
MSKITLSARGEDCAVRIPGVCSFDPETTVYAHAPCVDSGVGFKGPDGWGAYCCSKCHDLLDANRNRFQEYWLPAIYETQKKLREKELI